MVFSGIPFLYYFLPIILLAYFVVPSKGRNAVLLAASLLFYAWGEPVYVLLMLFSVFLGYVAGILLEKSKEKQVFFLTPKRVLMGAVVAFTGIFIYFKYTDFLIENINAAIGAGISPLGIALPIGISFYTFQIISYLVDVYRGEVPAQKNIVSLALYVSMFPQLIAGPIVRYQAVAEQLEKRKSTWAMTENGIGRFVVGLSKKVLIANELGALCQVFRASDEKTVVYYWIYALAFTLHIYFDFSGYSDMAIGLGKIFGFSFSENFSYPYISGSITEFWRRWHMSLGTWFRDYVYIPLGGNRVSRGRWYRNIFCVWMLTGLWHGASWNFFVWGLYFAILLIAEKGWLGSWLEKIGWLRHAYALFLIVIGFVIFNASHLSQAMTDIRCMLGAGGLPVFSAETGYYLRSYGMTLLVGGIGCTPLVSRFVKALEKKQERIFDLCKPVVLAALWILSTAYLVDGSFNPFLYFRF